MSEFVNIRGVSFRKKVFSTWSFKKFKKTYEGKAPYKRITPKYRDAALLEDFEKLTGKKATVNEPKESVKSDSEKETTGE